MQKWVFLFAAVSAFSQTPDTATIHGHVTDQTHAALAGVQVVLKNSSGPRDRTTQTDDSGNFTMAGLPVTGAYNIIATKSGFSELHLDDLTLTGGIKIGRAHV